MGEKNLQRASLSRGGKGHGTDGRVASMGREVHLQKSESAELQGAGGQWAKGDEEQGQEARSATESRTQTEVLEVRREEKVQNRHSETKGADGPEKYSQISEKHQRPI